MFDDMNRSFLDLDSSLLLQSDLEPLDVEYSEKGLELDDQSDPFTPATGTLYSESTNHSAKSDRQSLPAVARVSKHPRYQPIMDNGVTYTFEANPLLYKKIRK